MKTTEHTTKIQVRYTTNGIAERDIEYIRKHKNIPSKVDWFVVSQDFLHLSADFIKEFGRFLYWNEITFQRPYIDEEQIEIVSKYVPCWVLERWLSKYYNENYVAEIKSKYYAE